MTGAPKSSICCYQCSKADRPACLKNCPEWAAHEAEKAARYAQRLIELQGCKNRKKVEI